MKHHSEKTRYSFEFENGTKAVLIVECIMVLQSCRFIHLMEFLCFWRSDWSSRCFVNLWSYFIEMKWINILFVFLCVENMVFSVVRAFEIRNSTGSLISVVWVLFIIILMYTVHERTLFISDTQQSIFSVLSNLIILWYYFSYA